MVSSLLRRQALYFLFLALAPGMGALLEPAQARAQGGPPLATDDPGTPGNRHWELNVALTVEHTRRGTLYEAPLGDANYGLGDRIQLKLELPLVVERRAGTRAGLGNAVVGVKWRFLEDSSTGLTVSTYPQFEFATHVLPLVEGEEEPSTLLLPMELVRSWGRFGVNGETGYRVVGGSTNEVIYGLALGYDASGTLELLSECNGSAAQARPGELVCQLGARQLVGEHFSLLGALGRAVAGDPAERARVQLYLGLQSRW
jgi:hypothetical protein